jgi:hypothetical protein
MLENTSTRIALYQHRSARGGDPGIGYCGNHGTRVYRKILVTG